MEEVSLQLLNEILAPMETKKTNRGKHLKRHYRKKGEGVVFDDGSIDEYRARINMLGDMNDRRKDYRRLKWNRKMLSLADEYEQKKMPMMAAEVRAEALAMKRGVRCNTQTN